MSTTGGRSAAAQRGGNWDGPTLSASYGSRYWVTDYGGRYGCRGGATNGLVSNARLFFVRQLSSLSSAARTLIQRNSDR